MQDEASLLLDVLALDVPREALGAALDRVGGLYGLCRAGSEALAGALPEPALARVESILALARRLLVPPRLPELITSADDVAAYFRPRLALESEESFWALFIDARGRAIGHAALATGTLTSCLVSPREVFAAAIRARASAIVAVHNHPSGDPAPSPEDLTLTERLTEAGQLLGIPLLDHVVVARSGFVSLGGAPGTPIDPGLLSDGARRGPAGTWAHRAPPG